MPRAQFPANKRRALSAHTCPICRRRSFPLAPRAELRLNWLSAATRPGCLNHRVALIERRREGRTAARVSGLYVNERRPVTTKQEVDAASSNTEQMPNQISIMIGGAKKKKKIGKGWWYFGAEVSQRDLELGLPLSKRHTLSHTGARDFWSLFQRFYVGRQMDKALEDESAGAGV